MFIVRIEIYLVLNDLVYILNFVFIFKGQIDFIFIL